MSQDLLLMVDVLSKQKSLDKGLLFGILEKALANKCFCIEVPEAFEGALDCYVKINPETGEVSRLWHVISDKEAIISSSIQKPLTAARLIDAKAKAGMVVEEPVVSSEQFGRMDASNAKKEILDQVYEADRNIKAAHYSKMVGQLVAGVVQKRTKQGHIVDLGDGVEGVFLKKDLIPRENIHVGDRVKGIIVKIDVDHKPFVLLSRTCNAFLEHLFQVEVPEINEGTIEIKSCAREPGVRAKVIVKTNDRRVDPIGACVGMRGSRIQTVSKELNGERIDVLVWSENPIELVRNAIVPAEAESIELDEENQSMTLKVSAEFLPQMIGRNGQNIRLASRVTGWVLNAVNADEEREDNKKRKAQKDKTTALFCTSLDIDKSIANVLYDVGLRRIDQIATIEASKLQESDVLDEALATAIIDRAKAALLDDLLLSDLGDGPQPEEDLLAMDTVSDPMAYLLAKHGICSREQLADQSVGELIDLIEDFSEEEAAAAIMEARRPWFDAAEKKQD